VPFIRSLGIFFMLLQAISIDIFDIYQCTSCVATFHARISEAPKKRSGAHSEHQPLNELDPRTYAEA
jgi:hypothetical protein